MSIQNTLQKIDMVKLSLDCATQKCFKKIDRALKGIMIQDLTNCIKNFSKRFNNNLIIEILVVKGINDNADEFKKLNEALNDIKPARVDIGTINRPPAYQVEAVDQKDMLKLSKIITNIPVSLIYKNNPDKKEDFSKEEILKLIAHRPQSQYDIDNFFSDSAKKIVENLLKNNIIVKKDIAGVVFYRLNER
jgi:wyosine [tRNA(Phe)-imidazoG37] synthetase (radical SAM superfamily)